MMRRLGEGTRGGGGEEMMRRLGEGTSGGGEKEHEEGDMRRTRGGEGGGAP